jgi:hypothetical protein
MALSLFAYRGQASRPIVYPRSTVRASRSILAFAFALFSASAGCGGAPSPAQSPETVPAAPRAASSGEVSPPHTDSDAPRAAEGSPAQVPTDCADKSADLCTPPRPFVERLCAKPHQELALALFARKAPFTHLYLKSKVDELAFDEEVLALVFHVQPKGGMIVGSGNGSYDVLRWDGTCSRGVEAEVFTRSRPPKPRAAHVQWHRVGERMQSALIASSEAVKRAHAKRGKECKGAMTGDVSAACEKADASLVDAIVDYVRTTGELPEPEASQ